jgi:hypothetical protein
MSYVIVCLFKFSPKYALPNYRSGISVEFLAAKMTVLKLLSNWWPPSWIRLGYQAKSKKVSPKYYSACRSYLCKVSTQLDYMSQWNIERAFGQFTYSWYKFSEKHACFIFINNLGTKPVFSLSNHLSNCCCKYLSFIESMSFQILSNISNPTTRTGLNFTSAQFDQ